MWTVIYVSQSIETAKKLIDVLLRKKKAADMRNRGSLFIDDICGFIGAHIKIDKGITNNGNESNCYEVLVPSTELETAQDLIFENELF